jgi:hypothetical protein
MWKVFKHKLKWRIQAGNKMDRKRRMMELILKKVQTTKEGIVRKRAQESRQLFKNARDIFGRKKVFGENED